MLLFSSEDYGMVEEWRTTAHQQHGNATANVSFSVIQFALRSSLRSLKVDRRLRVESCLFPQLGFLRRFYLCESCFRFPGSIVGSIIISIELSVARVTRRTPCEVRGDTT
eukprot:scaffold454379_cov55-Attheya_sp.AAC.1